MPEIFGFKHSIEISYSNSVKHFLMMLFSFGKILLCKMKSILLAAYVEFLIPGCNIAMLNVKLCFIFNVLRSLLTV